MLFLDNFSGHSIGELKLENIQVHFYPPNCTSVLQPLDQGIIRKFKSFYRTRVLKHIIARLDGQDGRDVKPTTIQNCFATAGYNVDAIVSLPEFNSNDLIATYCSIRKIAEIDFQKFVTVDDEVVTEAVKTDEDIVCSVVGQREKEEEVEEYVSANERNMIDLKTTMSNIDQI